MVNEEPSHTCTYFSWSPPLPYKEYFQQGSWKQNLFAFPCSTLNFLLSFVSVGIFPYFILFLLSSWWKGLSLKFMLSRTGTHARPEDNRATYLPCSFIYLFFFFLPPSPGFGLIMVAVKWQLSPVNLHCKWIRRKRSGAAVCRATGLQSRESGSASWPSAASQDTVGPGTAVMDHETYVVSVD